MSSGFEAYPSSSGESSRSARPLITRRTLCIGIDNYPSPGDRLGCCVSDARSWQAWFAGRGFEVETLLDGQATGSGILSAVRRLIQGSRPGDVVVVQYSGHGTQLQGPGGDEEQDEALVPYDHRTNGCIIDDDIGELCNLIPEGVNVTFFMDCCHSGSNTRTLFGGPSRPQDSDVKIRFLWPDAEMQRIHQEKRTRGRARTPLPYANHREILFSACRSTETAKERSGHGDFTRYALEVLGKVPGGITNADFVDRVRATGVFNDQRPELWSDKLYHNAPFLGSRGGGTDVSGSPPPVSPGGTTGSQPVADSSLDDVIGQLQNLVDGLRKVRSRGNRG